MKLCYNYHKVTEAWIVDCMKIIFQKSGALSQVLKKEIQQEDATESSPIENQYVEDAVFVLTGILPRVYRNNNISPKKRMNMAHILTYLEEKIHEDERSMFFKFRYCTIIQHCIPSFSMQNICLYLDRVLILLSNCTEKSTQLVVLCLNIISRCLSHTKNYEYSLEGIQELSEEQISNINIIEANINYELFLKLFIKQGLFSEKYTSKLSPTEFYTMTNLIKVILREIDMKKNLDLCISLLECLDLVSNKKIIDCNTESEILSVWDTIMTELTNNPHILNLALIKLESVVEKENYKSFWLLNTYHQVRCKYPNSPI